MKYAVILYDLSLSAFAGRLNLHALASRAQAILKRPPSQLPFPIPSFNKNNNNNAAQLQRRSGLVLSFPIKKPQQQQQQQKSVGVDGNDDTISRQLSSSRALAGPPPQIVTVPPHIEGLQLSNHHIKRNILLAFFFKLTLLILLKEKLI